MSSPASTSSDDRNTFTPLNKKVKKEPNEAASTPTSSTSRTLSEDPDAPTPPTKKVKKEPKEAVIATPKKTKKDAKESDTPTPKKVKSESTPNKTNAIPLPHSAAEASEADKMLVREKDAGTPWSLIRTKWHQLTGQTVGHSTLPNRYARIKAYMVTFTPEQDAALLAGKIKVEKEFEVAKWGTIGQLMSGDEDGVKFSGAMVQRRFKELRKMKIDSPGKGDGESEGDMEE